MKEKIARFITATSSVLLMLGLARPVVPAVASAVVIAAVAEELLTSSASHAAEAWISTPLHRVGGHMKTDPAGVWSDQEIGGDGDLWEASRVMHTPDRQIIISQLVNGECESPSACPVRVILQEGGKKTVILDSAQMCAVASEFRVSSSLREIKACDAVQTMLPAQP